MVEVCPRGVCQGGGASSGGGAQLKVYQKGWGSCQLGGGARVKVYQKGGVLPARWWRKGGVVYLKEVLTGGWVPGLEAFGGRLVGEGPTSLIYVLCAEGGACARYTCKIRVVGARLAR